MQLFLTDKKIEIVVDRYNNSERDMETSIPLGLPLSPILYLIYINGIFDIITSTSLEITFISFMYDLRFLVSSNPIKKVTSILETTGEIIYKYRLSNTITYDITLL